MPRLPQSASCAGFRPRTLFCGRRGAPCFLLGGRLLRLCPRRFGSSRRDFKRRGVVLDADLDLAAIDQLAEQKLLRERLLDLLLDEPAHGASAVKLVVAAIGEPLPRLIV